MDNETTKYLRILFFSYLGVMFLLILLYVAGVASFGRFFFATLSVGVLTFSMYFAILNPLEFVRTINSALEEAKKERQKPKEDD